MIRTKSDLKEYMLADLNAAYVPNSRMSRFLRILYGNESCHAHRYVRYLRLTEYHLNVKNRFRYNIYRFILSRLSLRYGIGIRLNTTGKGLNIIHLNGGG